MVTLLILLFLVIAVAINCYFANLMNKIAILKGHENSNAFLLVFLFGVIGILYVIALPDLYVREQNEDIIRLLLDIKQGDEK